MTEKNANINIEKFRTIGNNTNVQIGLVTGLVVGAFFLGGKMVAFQDHVDQYEKDRETYITNDQLKLEIQDLKNKLEIINLKLDNLNPQQRANDEGNN